MAPVKSIKKSKAAQLSPVWLAPARVMADASKRLAAKAKRVAA